MNALTMPWLEVAVAVALLGAPIVSRFRDPNRANGWGLIFAGMAFVCVVLAWLSFSLDVPAGGAPRWSVQPLLFGRRLFFLDELSAPLLPAVAMLHFLM